MYFGSNNSVAVMAAAPSKIGVDGVLAGAWADVSGCSDILDVGTGCGLIALMCAQRNPTAGVLAIDIHRDSVEEAAGNFSNSLWSSRLGRGSRFSIAFGRRAAQVQSHCLQSLHFFHPEYHRPTLRASLQGMRGYFRRLPLLKTVGRFLPIVADFR